MCVCMGMCVCVQAYMCMCLSVCACSGRPSPCEADLSTHSVYQPSASVEVLLHVEQPNACLGGQWFC